MRKYETYRIKNLSKITGQSSPIVGIPFEELEELSLLDLDLLDIKVILSLEIKFVSVTLVKTEDLVVP